MSAFFKDWIFNQFPRYYQMNDTYKDGNGDGLWKRYLRVFGMELDENFVPYIDNFSDLFNILKCDDKFLPLIGAILGYPPSIDGTNETYRKVLAYAVAIYKIKGTANSFQILFNLLGLTINIIEDIPKKKVTYDADFFYDDGNFYDSECDNCSGYWIQYYSDVTLTTEQLAAITNIVNFLNPINAQFLGMVPVMNIEDILNITLNDESSLCGISLGLRGLFNPDDNTAQIDWNNTSGTFEVSYKKQNDTDYGAEVEVIDNQTTLTGLESGVIYYVRVRQKCSDGSYSPWVTILVFTQAGIYNDTGHDIKPEKIEYITNSTITHILTDFQIGYNFGSPITIRSILVDGDWITANAVINTKDDFLNWLNSLNLGTFTLDVNGDLVLLASEHVFTTISYIDSNGRTISVDFKQSGQKTDEPGVIISDFKIFLDFTKPLEIQKYKVNGDEIIVTGITLNDFAGALSWLNGLGIGTFSQSGNYIISIGNPNSLSSITYKFSGQNDIYVTYFEQRDIRIAPGYDKLVLTDYFIYVDGPIDINGVLINGETIEPGTTLNTQADIINWLNSLNKGTWDIYNEAVGSIGNQNTISKLTYTVGGNQIDVDFKQINQRINNLDGVPVVYTFPVNTTITNGTLYLYDIPAGAYDRITIFFPVTNNPIPFIKGDLITQGFGYYEGFIDDNNLVFMNIQIGSFTEVILH